MTYQEDKIEFEKDPVKRGDFPPTFPLKEKGDTISGILTEKKDNAGKHKQRCYTIQTEDGLKTVWGSSILDSIMDNIKVENILKITYVGDVKSASSGRMVKDYEVFLGKKKGKDTPKEKTKTKDKPEETDAEIPKDKLEACMKQYDANEETAIKLINSGAPVKDFE